MLVLTSLAYKNVKVANAKFFFLCVLYDLRSSSGSSGGEQSSGMIDRLMKRKTQNEMSK